jgi:uncharacterized repeat protein (TIGR03803 family)
MRVTTVVVLSIVLAACSHGGIPTIAQRDSFGPSTIRVPTPGASFKVLYRFKGGGDAEFPQGFLIPIRSTLYGTSAGDAQGTVFAVTTSGHEHVVYTFNGAEGGFPGYGALLNLSNKLYGTTETGGSQSHGTLFQLSTAGQITVLGNFQSSEATPNAGLLYFNGTIYGTTAAGGIGCGKVGCGTVFKLGPFGIHVIYRFKGYPGDGAAPHGALSAVNGTLYGTTFQGGNGYGCAISGNGCGTLFGVTPAGKEHVVYNFNGGAADGAFPEGQLLNVKGTLYGVTPNGGRAACSGGCGTVFAVTPAGKEHVVYRFAGGSDGAYPSGGLVELNGVLYGVTAGGGAQCAPSGRCGTVFSITTSGKKSTVYNFKGGSEGQTPEGALAVLNGKLYGTTSGGGLQCYGSSRCGTVFEITP